MFLQLEESGRLAAIIMRTGKLLLSSGGDVVSVKQAMKRVCATHSDAKKPEAIVGSNNLMFSFKVDHHIVTRICEVKKIGNDITRIEMIHNFTENCSSMSLDEMEKELDRIEAYKPIPRWIRVLASGICSAGFGLFFSDWSDAFYIFLIGLGAGWILTSKANRILNIIAASFFVTIIPILLEHVNIPIGIEKTVVSNMPLMVPGMVMFNAIRDTLNGNYAAGWARIAEALMIGASIAAGTGIALAVLLI
ncbi:threonine/serine exporter family protein [Erysipelotrichaceae bacterium 51-3]|uniref:threonine/serine exporter family protein n=1 Tax=Allobaculum sp. JKK-2023 TaxID=3108943 RepID=UPI002B053F89|nr:threonine/serine exporter family protein [Allobaculum sp. JKK-2023]